jgi:hypothetical protein
MKNIMQKQHKKRGKKKKSYLNVVASEAEKSKNNS